jgi:hypothetical protein
MRPSDWFLVELPGDPVPGDAFGIRRLAAKYASTASTAGEASDGVTRARSSGAASAWVGDAGDIFREKSHRMPGELARAHASYSIVAEALRGWAESVDDAQAQADRGLQLAREAHADLASSHAALGLAQSVWSTVHAQQLTYQKVQRDYLGVSPPVGITLPTPDQLRGAARSASQSQASIAVAQSRIVDADARLAAARALVVGAKARRDDAERTVVHRIAQAENRAVKPSSPWEGIQDSSAWQTLVAVATVVLTIVSILAIFLGGPLVWAIILAATLVLIVNALLAIAQGDDAWGELALLAVGLIPGGATAAAGLRVASEIGRAATIASRLKSAERAAREIRHVIGGPMRTRAFDIPNDAVRFSQKSVSFNKIDRATGAHYTYDDIVRSMRDEGWVGDAVDIVHMPDSGLTSVDNTRILAAREAGISVKGVIHDPGDPLTVDEIDRFAPKHGSDPVSWGDALSQRIGRQGASWSGAPYGKSDLPELNGALR